MLYYILYIIQENMYISFNLILKLLAKEEVRMYENLESQLDAV